MITLTSDTPNVFVSHLFTLWQDVKERCNSRHKVHLSFLTVQQTQKLMSLSQRVNKIQFCDLSIYEKLIELFYFNPNLLWQYRHSEHNIIRYINNAHYVLSTVVKRLLSRYIKSSLTFDDSTDRIRPHV